VAPGGGGRNLHGVSDWNDKIIAEFRANGGKVGGPFEGGSLLLLHSTGAKTGAERVHPLVYQPAGDDLVVFASNGGADRDPAWFANLMAHPETTVEVGTDVVPVRARVAAGEERERLWSRQKELVPGFADYEAKTSRQIPVVVLERTTA
jgi:deazaflavin-dependent oxidoreductase (nitroreductase family)